MTFENVQSRTLRQIWEESEAFLRFRGESWMQEPCRSCERRGVDFGGCRCQAMLLTKDSEATDPVCSLSPERGMVDAIVAASNAAPVADVVKADGFTGLIRCSVASKSLRISYSRGLTFNPASGRASVFRGLEWVRARAGGRIRGFWRSWRRCALLPIRRGEATARSRWRERWFRDC